MTVLPPSARAVRAAARTVFAALAALFVLLVGTAGPAVATPAGRLPEPITDLANALDGQDRTEIQQAVDTLYSDRKVQLWVAFVPSFDGVDADTWTERSAAASNFGPQTALLAVATQDREYALWTNDALDGLSASERDAITTDDVVPHLRTGDWSAAAVSAAAGLDDALGSSGSGSSVATLLVGGGVIAVAGGGVYAYSRRSRRKRVDAGVAAAEQIDPSDVGGLAALPLEALDRRASDVLVATDNAVRTSADELALAVGEFGEQATAPFTAAHEKAKAALAQAFTIRQRLDDDIPETPDQRRDMLVDIISTCGVADRELDAQVETFDGMRDLLLDAPARLDSLTQAVVTQTARLDGADATLATLTGKYPAATLAPVSDNVRLAREQLAFAQTSVDEGRAAAALPAGRQGAAVGAIRAAEGAVSHATDLLDGVDHADADITNAIASLPAAVADLEHGVEQAGPLATDGGASLVAARDAAQAALAGAREHGASDPLGSFTAVAHADTELDAELERVQQVRIEKARAAEKLGRELDAARSQITAASDFVTTRRGAVGAQARTRLAEAQRHLEGAQQIAQSDPATATRHAQAAASLAGQALAAAQADVRDWERRNRPPSGGNNIGGAVLGGIILDSVLRGAGSRGSWGGGFGGGPGSFGGSGSSGRIGGSSSGRF